METFLDYSDNNEQCVVKGNMQKAIENNFFFIKICYLLPQATGKS